MHLFHEKTNLKNASVEFFAGFILSLLLHYKTYNSARQYKLKLEAMIQAVGPGKIKAKSKPTKPFSVENLWKIFK